MKRLCRCTKERLGGGQEVEDIERDVNLDLKAQGSCNILCFQISLRSLWINIQKNMNVTHTQTVIKIK